MEKLTKRQKDVLEFIKKYIAKNAYSPSIRDICKGLKIESPSTINYHLKSLESKGYIGSINNKKRAIKLLVPNEYQIEDITCVPLINSNNPEDQLDEPEKVTKVPSYLLPKGKEVFTFTADDSLRTQGIYDKDTLIVERKNKAEDGDIIIALVNNEAILRKYTKENNKIKLSSDDETKTYDKIKILGKIIGLYRKI